MVRAIPGHQRLGRRGGRPDERLRRGRQRAIVRRSTSWPASRGRSDAVVVLRANIFTVVTLFLVITAVSLAFRGTVTRESVTIAAALLIPYGFTIWIGSRLFRRSTDRVYRLAVLWLLAAIGAFVAIY